MARISYSLGKHSSLRLGPVGSFIVLLFMPVYVLFLFAVFFFSGLAIVLAALCRFVYELARLAEHAYAKVRSYCRARSRTAKIAR